MQKPSDRWKRVRRAALERAQRTAIDPLSPLYDLYVGVCAMYLASFLHLNLFEHGTDLNLYAACLVIFVAITGILVPVLTGSILTLHFASKKLGRLIAE